MTILQILALVLIAYGWGAYKYRRGRNDGFFEGLAEGFNGEEIE